MSSGAIRVALSSKALPCAENQVSWRSRSPPVKGRGFLCSVYTKLTDARGYTTKFQVDVFGQPLRAVDPLGDVTLISRNTDGLPTRVQAPDTPRAKPFDAALPPDADPPFGLVLNQDVGNFARTQRGLHQPGFTHLTVSPTEECRVVNLHRTLEEFLGIGPEDG